MCRSKDHGGRRCDAKTPYHKSRTALRKAMNYASQDEEKISRLVKAEQSLDAAQQKYGDIVTHHSMQIDPSVESLLTDLRDIGGNPLIVGGAVRDSLLTGEKPKDIDIEIHDQHDVDELVRQLRRKGYRVDEVGRAFGVLKTQLVDGTDIDLSLPRRDNLVGNTHRDFEVIVDSDLSLAEAASRRDFTLNAMYYDHHYQTIVDPHGGTEDLKNGVLRHVSEAFREDPLRVLRGVQIASRFDLDMAEDTRAVCESMKDSFRHLSTERVQEEWRKFMLKGKNFEKGFTVLKETGWAEHFSLHNTDVQETSEQVTAVVKTSRRNQQNPEVFGAATLAMQIPEDKREQFIKNAVTGNRQQNQALQLANLGIPENVNTKREVKAWARSIGRHATVKQWRVLYGSIGGSAEKQRVQKISDIARKNASYHEPIPDYVTGAMVLEESGQERGGRWVGEILRNASRAQDNEDFTDESSSREWVKKQLELWDM